MQIVVFLILLILMGIIIAVPLVWYSSRVGREARAPSDPGVKLQFGIRYIAAPAGVLVVSQILAGVYYRDLSSRIAYLFHSSGLPSAYISRIGLLTFEFLIQLILVGIGAFIVYHVIKIVNNAGQIPDFINGFLLFMGNIPVIPQVVFLLVVADIASYDVTHQHVVPLWPVILSLIIVGIVILTVSPIVLVSLSRKNKKL